MVPAIEMSSQTASSIHDAKQTEEDSDNNMHKLAATAKKLSFEEQENVEQSELTKQKISNLVKSVPAVNAIFDIKDVIGEGTFSSVFLAHAKLKEDKKYALKYLVPTCHPNRILNELKCLKELGDKNNIIGVDLCLRNKDSIVFVMPYFTHDSFSSYIMNMDVDEIRQYMKNLLIALSAIHSSGIMHRDVKPSNFLYCRKQRRFEKLD
ncbi:CDC7 (predicted) [Pycnogonum litorale]